MKHPNPIKCEDILYFHLGEGKVESKEVKQVEGEWLWAGPERTKYHYLEFSSKPKRDRLNLIWYKIYMWFKRRLG